MESTLTSTAGVCCWRNSVTPVATRLCSLRSSLLGQLRSAQGIDGIEDGFRSCRRTQRRIDAIIGEARDRIADREKHREGQQQRWFTHRLGTQYRVFDVMVGKQPRGEMLPGNR